MSKKLSEVIWSHLRSFEIIWSHLSYEATKFAMLKDALSFFGQSVLQMSETVLCHLFSNDVSLFRNSVSESSLTQTLFMRQS